MNLLKEKYSQYQKLIGTKMHPTEWIEINQQEIDRFAKLTKDHQFIHVNPNKAKKFSPFGETIAHGFFILSLASKFAIDVLPILHINEVRINYGFNRIRFVHPVTVNSQVRGVFSLKNVEIKNEFSLVKTYKLSIEIKKIKKPAIVAEWLILNQYTE